MKIERGDEPELYTIDDGVDVMRPVVYIEVQVTDRDPDRHLINLQGRKQASERTLRRSAQCGADGEILPFFLSDGTDGFYDEGTPK